MNNELRTTYPYHSLPDSRSGSPNVISHCIGPAVFWVSVFPGAAATPPPELKRSELMNILIWPRFHDKTLWVPIIMSLKYEVCAGRINVWGSQRSLQINDNARRTWKQRVGVFLLMRSFCSHITSSCFPGQHSMINEIIWIISLDCFFFSFPSFVHLAQVFSVIPQNTLFILSHWTGSRLDQKGVKH